MIIRVAARGPIAIIVGVAARGPIAMIVPVAARGPIAMIVRVAARGPIAMIVGLAARGPIAMIVCVAARGPIAGGCTAVRCHTYKHFVRRFLHCSVCIVSAGSRAGRAENVFCSAPSLILNRLWGWYTVTDVSCGI